MLATDDRLAVMALTTEHPRAGQLQLTCTTGRLRCSAVPLSTWGPTAGITDLASSLWLVDSNWQPSGKRAVGRWWWWWWLGEGGGGRRYIEGQYLTTIKTLTTPTSNYCCYYYYYLYYYYYYYYYYDDDDGCCCCCCCYYYW